jgi:hypothetical protein
MPGESPSPTRLRSFQELAAICSRSLGAAEEATLGAAVETCLEQFGVFAGVDATFARLVDDAGLIRDDWQWVCPGRAVGRSALRRTVVGNLGVRRGVPPVGAHHCRARHRSDRAGAVRASTRDCQRSAGPSDRPVRVGGALFWVSSDCR